MENYPKRGVGMISEEELKRLALKHGIKNIGFAEKDYLLDLLLYSISVISKNEFIFKGGTCLSKLYGLRRFSEDLDFSLSNSIDISHIMNVPKRMLTFIERFGIVGKIATINQHQNSLMVTYHLQGPLYNRKHHQIASVRIDINLKSTVINPPALHYYTSIYPEIPMFPINSMEQTEITAEKIRAIMTRDKARDIYDLYYLLRADFIPSLELINKKLDDYSFLFNLQKFEDAIFKKKEIWNKELRILIVDPLTEFDTIAETILRLLHNVIKN